MGREANLGVDFIHSRRHGRRVARISVRLAEGFTADGQPTLTPDCPDRAAFERAVALLVDDLGAAVEEAARELGDAPAQEPAAEAPAAAQGARPHVDSTLTVAEVMTREVRTVERNDKVALASELMRVGQFRHTVVVDEQGEVAGVLSQNDLMLNALSWHLGQGRKLHERILDTALAKDLMRTDVATTRPDAPISEAAAQMAERRIGCLPVVDDASGLVGIVTESDLLGLLVG